MGRSTSTRAVASLAPGPVEAPDSFVEIDLEIPDPNPHDLLVEVRAVSVNPADGKVRQRFDPSSGPKVLGYDAAGVVVDVGPAVERFAVGDEVYYAGFPVRPGSNAELQLVDEHLVGHKPSTLSFAEAAAVPLTTITAWESLVDRLHLDASSEGTLLVMAGAGGVGSMTVQLARALTGATVVATASRAESVEWARSMGAHHVVDHHRLRDAVLAVAPAGVDWIVSPFSNGNVATYAEILQVYGEVVGIDEPADSLLPLKPKNQTWHWESMFAPPTYDPGSWAHHDLLERAAALFDSGRLRTTMTSRLSGITAETVREAHRRIESWSSIGKLVLERG
jgi:zinc-binding alcohol dehydrogenase family protein